MNPDQNLQAVQPNAPMAAKTKRGLSIVAILIIVLVVFCLLVAAVATPILVVIARNNAAVNHLRVVGLAIHNYESTFKAIPAIHSVDHEKKPTTNWRYAITPYIDAQYSRWFDNPPADLANAMPAVFRSPWAPSSQPKSHTNLFTIQHPKSAFREGGKWLGFASVIDGLSSTVFVIELPHHSIPWTQPNDLTAEEAIKLIRSSPNPEGLLILLGDGTVQKLGKLSDDEIMGVITAQGGETPPTWAQSRR